MVALPYHVVHAWPMLQPDRLHGERRPRSSTSCAALPDGALAISDDPGLVWRAGRRTTPDLVDASVLRIETGDITSGVASPRSPAEDDVCAVAVRSAARWGSFDDLPDRLAAAGYELAESDDHGNRLYLKPDCAPPEPRSRAEDRQRAVSVQISCSVPPRHRLATAPSRCRPWRADVVSSATRHRLSRGVRARDLCRSRRVALRRPDQLQAPSASSAASRWSVGGAAAEAVELAEAGGARR